MSFSVDRLGATVVAIDPSRENVAIASRHSKHDPTTAKIHFEQCTVGMSFLDRQQQGLCFHDWLP